MCDYKKLIFFLLTLILIILFSFSSIAISDDYFEEQIESSGANELFDNLNDEQKELLEKLGVSKVDSESFLSISPHKVFDLIFELISGNYQIPFKSSLTVAVVIVVISIASQFLSDNEKMLKSVSVFSVLIIV